MKCTKCQHENPDNTQFCGKCGEAFDPAEGVSLTKTLIAPAERFKEGSTVGGRYAIIEELGRGGMGVVYKAKDTKLKRTVALKFLPPELTHIPEVKERFMREAQAAAALDHPNICTVYEFDAGRGEILHLHGLYRGPELKKEDRGGPLELEEALRIATQVAEGLQEAHKKGYRSQGHQERQHHGDGERPGQDHGFWTGQDSWEDSLDQGRDDHGDESPTCLPSRPRVKRSIIERTSGHSEWFFMRCSLVQLPFKGEHEQAVVYSILKEKPRPITEVNARDSRCP